MYKENQIKNRGGKFCRPEKISGLFENIRYTVLLKEANEMKRESKVLRVAAYCRVSTDKLDQANSLESQQRYFNEYIARNPLWELAENT